MRDCVGRRLALLAPRCSPPKNLVGIPRNTPSIFRWAMVKNVTMLHLPGRLQNTFARWNDEQTNQTTC